MQDQFLKILSLLIREPNLSSVAEKLGTSQSNLSKILKRMEGDWGVRLFERKGFRGLMPTADAIRLGQIADQLAHEWAVNLNLVKNRSAMRQDLRVIGPLLWTQSFFIPFWYQSSWSRQLRLVMTVEPLSRINLQTVGANYDIVISNSLTYLENYVAKKLYREKYYLIFNREDAPESLKHLDATQFKWIAYRAGADPLQNYFNSQDLSAELIHSYLNDTPTAVRLVKGPGKFAACIPDHFYEREKDGLRGFEIDTHESEDLFFFNKREHVLSKEIYEELLSYIKS